MTTEKLIQHLQDSIMRSLLGQSKLTEDIFKIGGYSSPRGRMLMNNICSMPDVNFLEIGSHEGSTAIPALYGNNCKHTLIDSFNWGKQHKENLINNFEKYLGYKPNLIDEDCFGINPKSMGIDNINVYMYDGEHEESDQFLALTHYYDSLAHDFIYICDDTNHPPVLQGTFRAIQYKGLRIKYHNTLFAMTNGDQLNFWNGMYVAVLSKS